MIDHERHVLHALGRTRELERVNLSFIDALSTYKGGPFEYGELKVVSGKISIKSLNQREIKVNYRPVVVAGSVASLEYSFSVTWRDIELNIMRLYFQQDGEIFYDTKGESKFCHCNNTLIVQNLLLAIANALLHSKVYEPGDGLLD